MKPIAKVGMGCLVIFLTCIGGLGVFVFRVSQAKVNPVTDYAGEIEAMVVAQQGGSATDPNRWKELEALLDEARALNVNVWAKHSAAIAGDGQKTLLEPGVVRGEKSSGNQAKEQEAVRELLADMKSQELFSKVIGLKADGHFVRPLQKGVPLIEVLLPDLAVARGFARTSAAQMRLANEAAAYQDFLEAFEACCVVGHAYVSQGILIDRLVGQAILSLALTELVQGNIAKPLPADVLRKCMTIMESTCNLPPVQLSLETERRSVKDIIQWTFSDSGDGDGWYVANSKIASQFGMGNGGPARISGLLGSFSGVIVAGRKETTKKADEFFDGTISYCKAPRQARIHHAFQPDLEVAQLSARFMPLKYVLPALGSAASSYDQVAATISAIRQLIATELYMRENGGTPPAAASDLVPQFLKELATDPVSGKKFGYLVLKPGEDLYGRRYLLYSFGSDGVDNGGTENVNPAERMKAWQMTNNPLRGIDLVINVPDESVKMRHSALESAPGK